MCTYGCDHATEDGDDDENAWLCEVDNDGNDDDDDFFLGVGPRLGTQGSDIGEMKQN